jgi:hypothetical protein
MTNSVPMSSDIAASARLANMIRAPLTQSVKTRITDRGAMLDVSRFRLCRM